MALILSHQTACEYWLSPYAKSAYRPDPDKIHLFADPNYLVSEKEHYCSQRSDAGKPSRTLRSNKAPRVYGASGSSSIIDPVSLRRNGKEATTPLNDRQVHDFFSVHEDVFSPPYHVLVLSEGLIRSLKDVVFHKCTAMLPKKSFYMLSNDVYVVSPELCLIQLAPSLSRVEQIKLGYEFTGQYAFDKEENLFFRMPLTSVDRIQRYLMSSKRLKGCSQLKAVLSSICDNSASPRETELSMLLSLPASWGGFGFQKPELNKRINIPNRFSHLFLHNYYICDLFLRDNSVAIEYDSDDFHVGVDRISNDSAKRSALLMLGINVITVTNYQIKNPEEMTLAARAISKIQGKKYRKKKSYNYDERQRALRQEVLSRNRRHGAHFLRK